MHTKHRFSRRTVRRLQRGLAILGIFAFVFAFTPVPSAQAATVTKLKDTETRLATNTLADHTIQFVTPSGVGNAAATTMTLTFAAGFGMGTFAVANVDLAVDNDAICDGPFTDRTLAATNGVDQWGVAQALQVMTFTGPSSGTSGIPANTCIQIEIGSNATAGAAGATQITNPAAAGNGTVTIGGTFGDSGTLANSFIVNEQVSVTATVDPTITFTVDDNTIGFGTLATSTGRWATGDTLGGNASAALPTAAHTMTIATNAQSGWAITYNGATLTSGANTIAVATIVGDSDGVPGTEQFALGASTSGDSTVASGYLRTNPSNWKFVAGSAQTLISEAVPTLTETISVSYLANIAATTKAGSYSTTLTYIATATF